MSTSSESYHGLGYVDVHCHLIHDKFKGIEDEIALKCKTAGMDFVVVNGLEPISNRQVLELCNKHKPYLLPALGIYPLDAACNVITEANWNHPFPPPEKFDVDAEVDFIDEMAGNKLIAAVGECGLDKHYLTDDTSMQEQERVLRKLMKVAVKHDIPIILHSRKAEKRVFEMLKEEGVVKADFHCYCGKLLCVRSGFLDEMRFVDVILTERFLLRLGALLFHSDLSFLQPKLGVEISQAGYYLSIPSAIASTDKGSASSFRKLAAMLPFDKILTETDSPYMGPVKGTDNDPTTVILTIDTLAEIKGVCVEEARDTVRNNFRSLFGF